MKMKRIFFGALFLAACSLSAEEEYRVGIEDMLDVRVMDQQGLDGSYTVAPDGSITVPMAGTVPVKGLTLDEVRKQITARLENGYLRYPVVTVALAQSKKKARFFIYGEVKAPGEYPIPTAETVTALTAVTAAGGVAKSGSETRLKILRPKAEGEAYEVMKVDLKAVMSTGEGDVVVKDGDILIVQEGWF